MQFAILSSLSDGDRRRVLAGTERRTFGRGEMLFHQGDPGDTMHLIAKGRVAVRITTPMGEQATLGVLGRGDVVGTFAAITEGHCRAASVQALEPTETLSLTRDQLSALRRAHSTIEKFVVDVLIADVRRVDRLLLEALYVPVDLRVLRRLVDLTSLYGRDLAPGSPVEIALTQQDLASMAGTSRATANRVLRGLEQLGAVKLSRNRIHVLDEAALRRQVGKSNRAR